MKHERWCRMREVRCLTKASSSLKTPAIPPFYKIITDNQSTKLVYNLVYRKFQGSRFKRRGYWSRFSVRFGCLLGGGGGCEGQALAGWILVLRLAEAVEKNFVWFYVGYDLVADRDDDYPL